MHRSWKTSEMVAVLASLVGTFVLLGDVPIKDFAIGICILINAFTIARTLFKKNRGQFHSGFVTGEFVGFVLAQAFVLFAYYKLSLEPLIAFWLIIINPTIYMVCRGITKSIGVKTQTIFQ